MTVYRKIKGLGEMGHVGWISEQLLRLILAKLIDTLSTHTII